MSEIIDYEERKTMLEKTVNSVMSGLKFMVRTAQCPLSIFLSKNSCIQSVFSLPLRLSSQVKY